MQYAGWNKTDFVEAFGGYLYSDFWLRDIFTIEVEKVIHLFGPEFSEKKGSSQ